MIRIEQCGGLTTLQDIRRSGWQAYGVSLGGAMDAQALFIANTLVLNEINTTALEITQAHHRFYTDEDLVVAFAGGGLQPICKGKELALHMPHYIPAGNEIELKQPMEGFRLYMSVMGGFEALSIFGSTATDLSLQAGGYDGRALKKGDVLRVHRYKSNEQLNLLSILQTKTTIASRNIETYNPVKLIDVFPGPEWDVLSAEAKEKIQTTAFTIGMASNRMGYILENNLITGITEKEIISSPVTQGTIQHLPSGKCMLLMADAQTVGGYPRILQTAMTALPLLAQKKPGDAIRFRMIDVDTACKQQQDAINKLQSIKKGMQTWFQH